MRLPLRRHARPNARRSALVAGLVTALAGGLPSAAIPAQAADGTVTSFAFTSDPTDYVGGGQGRSYTPSDATFTIRGTAGSLRVSVEAGGDWWDVALAAPAGGQLSPGSYQNAARAPFNGAYPGLSVTGTGRGCNTVKGFFDITALSVDSHGQVTTLDASFTQFCDAGTGALRGSVRYAAPPSGDVVLTSSTPTSVEGQSVVLSAKILPGTNTAVTFRDGATVLGTSSAGNAGVAKWGIEAPGLGTHTYTAVQGATTSAPTSAPVTQTVLSGATSLYFRSANLSAVALSGSGKAFAVPFRRRWHMDALVALAISIAILIAGWTYVAIDVANLPVWAGIVAWGCFFAAGGKTTGLTKTIAANLSGVFWAFLALQALPRAGGGTAILAVLVGLGGAHHGAAGEGFAPIVHTGSLPRRRNGGQRGDANRSRCLCPSRG